MSSGYSSERRAVARNPLRPFYSLVPGGVGPSSFSYPAHESTGNLGYFGNCGSLTANRQRENTEPRSDLIS